MIRAVDIVLDSGAYSAWKKRETLSVQAYIEFVQENHHHVKDVVGLDVIPAEFGRKPTAREVQQSAQSSWDNNMAMKKAGLDLMPVYHQGEQRYWLERMIGEGFTYIGISPANDRTTGQKVEWLDEIFGYLCACGGYPSIKTHGFGVTSVPIMFRYPWYSVDSVTWMLVGGYGGVLVPAMVDGVFDYTQSPSVVMVSERGSRRGKITDGSANRHIRALGRTERQAVTDYLEAEGFTIPMLRDEWMRRQQANVRYFKAVCANAQALPFRPRRRGLFAEKVDSPHGSDEPLWGPVRMIFTVTASPEHSQILQWEKVRLRLLTYYYFQAGETFSLAEYARTGDIPRSGKRRKKAPTRERLEV